MAQAVQASTGGSRACPRPHTGVHQGCPAVAMSLGRHLPTFSSRLQPAPGLTQELGTWRDPLWPTGSPSAPLQPPGLRALPPLLHMPPSLLPFVQSSLRGRREPHIRTQMSLARDAAVVEGPGCSLGWEPSLSTAHAPSRCLLCPQTPCTS